MYFRYFMWNFSGRQNDNQWKFDVENGNWLSGIKYIDYKDPDFLMRFVNEQGKILPRRITGTSLKYQRKVSQAIKRCRHLALMPYVGDMLK